MTAIFEMRSSIGWDTPAQVEDESIGDVLDTIDSWDVDEIRQAASSMLSNRGDQTNPTPWHKSTRARHTARNLWPTLEVLGGVNGGNDLLMETINHPTGDLAEFWTKVVQWEWTNAGDAWTGLPDEWQSSSNACSSLTTETAFSPARFSPPNFTSISPPTANGHPSGCCRFLIGLTMTNAHAEHEDS